MFFVAPLCLLSGWVEADAAPPVAQAGPQVGDCVIFREGGDGRLLKAPTYWLKGTIAAISAGHRVAGRCPELGKSESAYTRADWLRVAESTPCAKSDAEVREVPVVRIRFRTDDWETPWSSQHGSNGWLFRGYFLDQPLRKGAVIDMDSTWLERCEPRS